MSLFTRCQPSDRFEPSLRSAAPRRIRTTEEGKGAWAALAGFAEDFGILVRYAAGLDYYSRDLQNRHR